MKLNRVGVQETIECLSSRSAPAQPPAGDRNARVRLLASHYRIHPHGEPGLRPVHRIGSLNGEDAASDVGQAGHVCL